jgi:thermitase
MATSDKSRKPDGGAVDGPCECVSPAAPPWLPYDQCLTWYESRILDDPDPKDREFLLEFLIVYEHCVQLEGRKQGPLLFTTTLLPKEKLKLYHFDRYRRVRSETDTFSVQTSFRQYVSALHQAWGQSSVSAFDSRLTDVRKSSDASAGTGGLLGFLGISAGASESTAVHTSHVSDVSVQSVAGTFDQILQVASQAVDTERSVVVSTFEERDQVDVTQREIVNDNDCRAVTYFVRRVLEVYRLRTRIRSIYWRLSLRSGAGPTSPWRSSDDLAGVNAATRNAIETIVKSLRRDAVRGDHEITLPTDGTLYETELAHCSSCEPEKEAEHAIALQKAKADAELVATEVQRRQKLIAAGKLDPFVEVPPANP